MARITKLKASGEVCVVEMGVNEDSNASFTAGKGFSLLIQYGLEAKKLCLASSILALNEVFGVFKIHQSVDVYRPFSFNHMSSDLTLKKVLAIQDVT
jgi:hypothetical protein